MFASLTSVRATFKIAAIYTFALSTAVACSKFEVAATNIGTAKGLVASPSADPAGVAPTEFTVSIGKVEIQVQGADEFGQQYVGMKIPMMHGTKPVTVSVFPQVQPYVQDSAKQTLSGVVYAGEGVCGNETCTKYAVMINVTDTTNGADFQRVELWDTTVNASAPLSRLTQTAFTSVTEAYETLTASRLNE